MKWLQRIVLVVSLGLAAPASSAEPKVMLYGDSLMAGFGLAADEGFESQLRAALAESGKPVQLVNASVSGDTTADGLNRLAWSLGDKPDAVIVELGANDMLRGLPAETTQANLDAILSQLHEAGLPVLLVGMKADRALGADYVSAFDSLYPVLSTRYGALLYTFYFSAIGLDPAFYQSDLHHPNKEGIKRIVKDMVPSVEALLEQIR